MIKPGFSIWLDALRALAALTVLFGHFAHIRFTRGDYYVLREINVAADAVIVFFVISGLVISHAAMRDGSLPRFAFNRITRLITVVFPALVLTMLFDQIGLRINQSAYPDPYYQQVSASTMLLRGLTFSTEWVGAFDRVRLGTNGPLWSLSYEAAYYILFGMACFLRGPVRIAALAIVAFVAGLPILILMPAWLAGVYVWRCMDTPLSNRAAWLLALGFPTALIAFKAAGTDILLSNLTAAAFGPVNHHLILGYSDEVLWNLIIAVCVAMHLIGVARLLSRVAPDETGDVVRAVRYVAGASFSIYVVHYPTMHVLDAALPETLPGYDLVFLVITLAVSFAFAAAFERPLRFYRNLWPLQVRTL